MTKEISDAVRRERIVWFWLITGISWTLATISSIILYAWYYKLKLPIIPVLAGLILGCCVIAGVFAEHNIRKLKDMIYVSRGTTG